MDIEPDEVKYREIKQLEKFGESRTRWSQEALKQMTYINSLVITLAVGFIAFAFEYLKERDIQATMEIFSIDLKLTLYCSSVLLMLWSVFLGILGAHNRAIYFRKTRDINIIRHRVYRFWKAFLKEGSFDEKKWYERLGLQFRSTPKINFDDCLNYGRNQQYKDDLERDFDKLREYRSDLADMSWRRLNWQISIFCLGLTVYFFALLM